MQGAQAIIKGATLNVAGVDGPWRGLTEYDCLTILPASCFVRDCSSTSGLIP